MAYLKKVNRRGVKEGQKKRGEKENNTPSNRGGETHTYDI